MIRVIIPVRYLLDDVSSAPTDGYTTNDEWIHENIHEWMTCHNVDNIQYRAMTGDFYINFKDEALAALFKLTFPK